MRIGLKLNSENKKVETYRWSIFNIAKLKPINENDVDSGTYVWDLKGDCYISPSPIYDIENAINEEEQKFSYAMLLTVAKQIDKLTKAGTRKTRTK